MAIFSIFKPSAFIQPSITRPTGSLRAAVISSELIIASIFLLSSLSLSIIAKGKFASFAAFISLSFASRISALKLSKNFAISKITFSFTTGVKLDKIFTEFRTFFNNSTIFSTLFKIFICQIMLL